MNAHDQRLLMVGGGLLKFGSRIMGRTRSFLAALSLLVCLQLLASPAFGWELELAGRFYWLYESYAQRGDRGFFGPYNVDLGSIPSAANLNFWNGGEFDTNITTGSYAGWSYYCVEFEPVLRVNEAIRFKGKYRMGSYGNPANSYYYTQDAPGVNNAFSEGQWTMFWVTANTPWGIFGIGKRPWQYGTALQYDGADALTTESMLLVVPLGPLDIGFGVYPYRFAGSSGITDLAGNGYYGDPFDIGRDVPIAQYFSRADRNGTLSSDLLAFVNYHGSHIQAGILGAYGSYHIGPEATLQTGGTNQGAALDSEYFHGTAYAKFTNGKFFVNAEAAWLYWTDRYSVTGGPALFLPNPRYVEQWRYAVQAGMLAGPAKLSVLAAMTPGPDRRNGRMIGKQSAAFVRHPTFDTHLGNYDLFHPFSYIFSYNYGSGLNAYNLSLNGYVRDAFVLATRLDYALASNLNVFASFFHAERASHGYGWSCLGPNCFSYNGVAPDGNVSFNFNGHPRAVTPAPNIPDTGLGYEIGVGFDWKLLEGWTAGVVLAYWKPGRWFSYACLDRSVPNYDAPSPANFFGTRPGRTIDPVMGGEFSLTFDF